MSLSLSLSQLCSQEAHILPFICSLLVGLQSFLSDMMMILDPYTVLYCHSLLSDTKILLVFFAGLDSTNASNGVVLSPKN